MRKITLSIEDDLFDQAVAYAKQHHMTLEQLIENFLKEIISGSNKEDFENRRHSRKDIYKI